MASSTNACLRLTPVALYVIYAYTLLFLGIYALAEDYAVKDNSCGRKYHMWKYAFLNVILWFFASFSYLLWRGGGEGARARAVVLTSFYFGLFVWGYLMWQDISKDSLCDTRFFESNFHIITLYHYMCTVTDGFFFVLYFLHETYVGKMLGADFTIMPDVHSLPRTTDTIQSTLPASASTQPSPPAPAGLPPQLSYEYEKIMQHTSNNASSSSTLPQTTP